MNKYAGNPGSRKFTFFNGAVISAAPKVDVPMVSEVIFIQLTSIYTQIEKLF